MKSQNLFSEISGAGSQDPNRVVATQASLLLVPDVVNAVADQVGLPRDDVDTLRRRTRVETAVDSDVITVSVRWRERARSMAFANAFATVFVAYRARLDNAALVAAERDLAQQITALRAAGDDSGYLRELTRTRLDLQTRIAVGSRNTEIVEQATEATQVAPRPARAAVLAGIAGALIAVLLVAALQVVDLPLRGAEDVRDELGAPLLSIVPQRTRGRAGAPAELAVLSDTASSESEAYRLLSGGLALTNVTGGSRVVLVTSALPSEGKTTVAGNLAAASAKQGRDVVIVDGDLRRPRLASAFGRDDAPGLINVLTGDSTLAEALTPIGAASSDLGFAPRQAGEGGLLLLPAGPAPPNPGDFIASERLRNLIDGLRAEHDLVVIDGPPWLVAADALLLTRLVDGVVVVARRGRARRRSLRSLRESIGQTRCAVLGIVFLGGRTEGPGEYGSYGVDAPGAGSSGSADRRHRARGDQAAVPDALQRTDA